MCHIHTGAFAAYVFTTRAWKNRLLLMRLSLDLYIIPLDTQERLPRIYYLVQSKD